MKLDSSKNGYFESSHLTILACYSIFSVILIAESFLLGWEKWALILLVAGVTASWVMHIRQILPPRVRTAIYAVLIMITAFFYGTHVTSTYDIGLVMTVVILLLVSTGEEKLILLSQCTYYLIMIYDIAQMVLSGEVFDGLLISRTALHIVVITVVCHLARAIIHKWTGILQKSEDEKQELEEAAEKLNDFLANISHEIRTPINAVIGLTGVCLEKDLDADVRKNLQAVADAGRRVGDQISDILDYSEIEMDSLAVNEEEYMLSSLLNDIVMEIGQKKKDSIELVIDVDPKVPSVMSTDIVKLKKIIRHLIENGLKYTKEGGVYVRITSEERAYGINLRVEVKDTGIGMSASELEKVWDRFYQADSGRDRSTSGLGLGLSIVNGFTRSLKGFLTIESTQGVGTTVRVSIPQKVRDTGDCMYLADKKKLRIGAFLHFEKYDNLNVREYYNAMVRDLTLGLKVEMQRADNLDMFRKLCDVTHFTHVFVGQDEYEESPEFFDSISGETLVAVVCGNSFIAPDNSNIRAMRKPFYCFPVISFLNSDIDSKKDAGGKLRASGVRALVVDDEPLNHIVAKGILSGYGMEVSNADSGPDAINYIRENDVDIIFMDHMMPGMDGVEAMKRIRNELGRERKDVPIVALTANAVSTAKEMFIREGFDAFLAKPIEIYELERILRKVLPKSKISEVTAEEGTVSSGARGPADPEETGKAGSAVKSGNAGSVEKTGVLTGKPAESTAEDDSLSGLKEYGIDTEAGLRYCQNDRDFYGQILLQYASDADNKIHNAGKFLEDKDYSNYGILVHAIKSTSKMIGSMELYDNAFTLEKAAENLDAVTIDRVHADTMALFKRTADGILHCLKTEPADEAENNDAGSDDDVMEFDAVLEFDPEGGDGQ